MGLEVGQVYSFATCEHEGRKYICIDCGADTTLQDAMQIVEANGMKIVENNS